LFSNFIAVRGDLVGYSRKWFTRRNDSNDWADTSASAFKIKQSTVIYFPGLMDSENESGTLIRRVGNILQSTCGDVAGKLKRIPLW